MSRLQQEHRSASDGGRAHSTASTRKLLRFLQALVVTLVCAHVLNLPERSEGLSLRQWSATVRQISDKRSRETTSTGGKVVKENGFTNTCRCACCYQVGEHTECVSPTYTMFDVKTCTTCNVDSCRNRFPISCNEPTSAVNTVCIVRKGWLVRLVPICFLIISAGLLIYGLFIKKYDGYNPSAPTEPLLRRSRARNAPPVDQRASLGAALST